MKKGILIIGGLLLALASFHNTLQAAGNVKPEIEVEVNGKSFSSISSYLAKFVNVGSATSTFGAMGTTVVEFQVSTTGELSDFRVINSVTQAVDSEVIRVLKETSGSWNPGTVNGKAVSMKREASVVFKPNKNYNLMTISKKFCDKGDEELMAKKDGAKAAKQYDKAVALTPYDQSVLARRGLARYEAGDVSGAKEDWNRVKYLNDYDPSSFRFSIAILNPALSSTKGYGELKALLP